MNVIFTYTIYFILHTIISINVLTFRRRSHDLFSIGFLTLEIGEKFTLLKKMAIRGRKMPPIFSS